MVSLFGDYKKQSFFHLCSLETILFKKENLFSEVMGSIMRIRESWDGGMLGASKWMGEVKD